MSCVRLLRLFWVILSGIFISIMDEACSVIYNAYDFGIGFITANEDIAKSAIKLVDYEPSADLAQFTAENNIALALSYLDDIESKFPDVTCAWKTQRAAVYVLRDMKHTVEKMLEIYMLDETDAEMLLEDLSLKIQNILCAPKHMPAKTGVRNLLKNVLWIKNENVLDMIMDNCTISSFSDGDTVDESRAKQDDVKIIASGILQVSGINDGSKTNILANTDSLWYFLKMGSFCEYLLSPETLGILGYLLRSDCATSTVCIKECQLMNVSFRILEEAENQFGDLSFRMWRPIALQIAQFILESEEVYEYWSEQKIKIHLEEGIFPDLSDTREFEVHEAIQDMVLIQGHALDLETDVFYTGPAYIPSTVRKLDLIGDPESRPRVVIILLREEKYHSQTLMGWIKPSDISYKGLCLVHGIKRASLYGVEQLQKSMGAHRSSFIQTLGEIFTKTKGGILQSDASA